MKNNLNTQSLAPAFPTFPAQNQFGQTIMFTGFVKLEIIALQMLPYVIKEFHHSEDAFAEALKMADDFLKATEEFINKNTPGESDNKLITV